MFKVICNHFDQMLCPMDCEHRSPHTPSWMDSTGENCNVVGKICPVIGRSCICCDTEKLIAKQPGVGQRLKITCEGYEGPTVTITRIQKEFNQLDCDVDGGTLILEAVSNMIVHCDLWWNGDKNMWILDNLHAYEENATFVWE